MMAIGAAALGGARPAWSQRDALDPRTLRIAAETSGIDIHNHIDVPLTGAGMLGPDLDLKGEMQRAGLSAICMTFATDYQPGDAYGRFLNALAAMDHQLQHNGMKRSLTVADLAAARRNSQPTVIQAVEGAHFLEGHLERVEEAYGRGLRHLGLLHDSDATVPLGDVYTNVPRLGGLTAFGASVIQECNRLGILVDLAHANVQTTEMALKQSRRPVLISHTGLDTQPGSDARMAQMMRPRLIGKAQARMVADRGGAVGVWTRLSKTPLEYATNIRAMVDVIGVDHVCIGTDTKLIPAAPDHAAQQPPHVGDSTNGAWVNQRAGFYFLVVDAMLKTGFTSGEIEKIGRGNYLRIFGEAVG
ncbi:peptidase M19 [Acidipila sp. EB88]|nr:peptidase M19 [Acidipila sp. EB88]